MLLDISFSVNMIFASTVCLYRFEIFTWDFESISNANIFNIYISFPFHWFLQIPLISFDENGVIDA